MAISAGALPVLAHEVLAAADVLAILREPGAWRVNKAGITTARGEQAISGEVLAASRQG